MSSKTKERTATGAVLTKTCVFFTVYLLSIYVITTIVLGRLEFTTNIGKTAAIFAMAAVSAVSTLVYETKLKFKAAHTIVFMIIGIMYYLVVVVLPGFAKDASKTLVALGLYIIAFSAVTVVMLMKRKAKKADKPAELYTKRF